MLPLALVPALLALFGEPRIVIKLRQITHHIVGIYWQQDLLTRGEKFVQPGQLSEMIAAPQAAASNRRTEGEYPAIAMSRRVTFSVKRTTSRNSGCQAGLRCVNVS